MQFNFSSQSANILSNFGKPKRRSMGIGSLIILTIVGLMFVGGSYLFIKDDVRSKSWPNVQGTVTSTGESLDSDGKTMYSPVVGYEVDGKKYTSSSSSSSSIRSSVGESRTVHYNPANPADGVQRNQGLGLFLYIFPVIGIAVIGAGIFGFVRSKKRGEQINNLKQSGVKLQGVVSELVTQRSGTSDQGGVSQTSTKVIVSAAGSDGTVKNYESDWINGNTFGLANYRQQPVAVDVYVDPANPGRYYVDIDDIPALTAESIASMAAAAHTSSQGATPQSPAASPPIVPLPTSPLVPGNNTANTVSPAEDQNPPLTPPSN